MFPQLPIYIILWFRVPYFNRKTEPIGSLWLSICLHFFLRIFYQRWNLNQILMFVSKYNIEPNIRNQASNSLYKRYGNKWLIFVWNSWKFISSRVLPENSQFWNLENWEKIFFVWEIWRSLWIFWIWS